MDWVEEFYSKQQSWSNGYTSEITNTDKQKVNILKKLVGKPPRKILELGAGGGQFAVAAANQGYEVTAIELIDTGIKHMKSLVEKRENLKGNLNIIKGDFYEVDLAINFDTICYWDSFGIGTDEDQQRLLKRIENWLIPEGTALIDIYTPWYWANAAGEKMEFGEYKRKYNFDARDCKMLDTWWPKDNKNQKTTQELRCYSPADLELLLQDISLEIKSIKVGGALNYETMEYREQVPLQEAMSYMANLKKQNN